MTKDEQKRLEHFNKVSNGLINEGYEVSETSMGIVKANVLTLLMFAPLAYFILKLYGMIYSPDDVFYLVLETQMITLLVIAILLLTIAHELLHGLTWAIFTPNGFKDVAFGFILKYLTPYCSCKLPLKRGQYVLGVLMPLIVLGIIPTVIGFVIRSVFLTLLGTLFIAAAGGDIIMFFMIITYKKGGKDILVYDNPTKMGVSFFKK